LTLAQNFDDLRLVRRIGSGGERIRRGSKNRRIGMYRNPCQCMQLGPFNKNAAPPARPARPLAPGPAPAACLCHGARRVLRSGK